MGLLSNRVERPAMKAGDHIYTWKALYAYSHHDVAPACQTFPDCGFHQPRSGVFLSCLDCFLVNGSLYRFDYGVSCCTLLAKVRGGTCTTAVSDPPEAVIERAMHLLHSGFGDYNVFGNNCEDFAIYCKTGLLILKNIRIGSSGQASQVFGASLGTLVSVPLKAVSGPVGTVVGTVTYYASRYYTDIGVRKDAVKVQVEGLETATRKGSS